nr:LuxR C-terminal-related transcriptional regulator [Caldimonas sp.]
MGSPDRNDGNAARVWAYDRPPSVAARPDHRAARLPFRSRRFIGAPVPSAAANDLLLQVMPPRLPRYLVARERLFSSRERLREQPVVLVQAPAGFGKTLLLAQWRREHLAQGAVVAWLSAQSRDDAPRLVQALTLAVRVGAARPAFGHGFLEDSTTTALEGLTSWLAEVAHSALDLVLMVDDADRLAPPSVDFLAYLLRNAPPNLRVVVATRPDSPLAVDDLVDEGHCSVVGPALLRFQLTEAIELVRDRLGRSADVDTAARLHELTEGWPLGLQLAVGLVAQAKDRRAQVLALAADGGAQRERFAATLLSNLAREDAEFLTRIAILDDLHPDLCSALTSDDDAGRRLARLTRDTPVLVPVEQGEWLRMHTLARDELRRRFAALPADEQAALHMRAANWLSEHGLLEEAARHALASGHKELAYDLAERSLYECIITGRRDAVLEWLVRLPAEELNRRPRALLAAAWTLATSARHEEARHLVQRILTQADADDALRCECALILSGAASYADEPDRYAELHAPWATSPPLRDPVMLQAHANRSAFLSLLEGEPALARRRLQDAPSGRFRDGYDYIGHWGDFVVGLSYLWEGQVMLAEEILTPALASAEAKLGRRSSFTAMLASLLATAHWERERPAEAAALLANRLDVLERNGLPETVLLGYRTLARIAVAEGSEHRAVELLGAMYSVGVSRRLPRLCVASLVDQVRMHARSFRSETCRDLLQAIDALLAKPDLPQGRLWRRSVELLRDVAHGHAAIAARDWQRALGPLSRADAIAQDIKQGRLHIELLGLRAYALNCCDKDARPLLNEAVGLARMYGLMRVFGDAHPELGEWVRKTVSAEDAAALPTPRSLAARPRDQGTASPLRSTASTALTPKEREVLELLARRLSNKEIGRALQVGEQTVKWHMKHLFAKLDAGARTQVVQRARILGLLQPDD